MYGSWAVALHSTEYIVTQFCVMLSLDTLTVILDSKAWQPNVFLTKFSINGFTE